MKLKQILILLIFLLIISLSITYYILENKKEIAKVIGIIDGDTIKTNKGVVRLKGINAPEYGENGYEKAKNFLEYLKGKEILMVKSFENKDKYGRLLRYIYYNNTLINEIMLKKGFAHLYYYRYDSYYHRLKKAEKKAIKNKVGMWEMSKDICSRCIILDKLNNIDPNEYTILKNICNYSCDLFKWKIKDDAHHIFYLNFSLKPNETKKIIFDGRVWNDDKDTFFLYNRNDKLVIWYRYGYV